MSRTFPFYTKLAAIISLIGIFVCGIFFVLALWSGEKYHQEVTQRLHRDLAPYILDHLPEPLFAKSLAVPGKGGEGDVLDVNKHVLKGIAMNTMMINPSVEVYLLDVDGEILGHALPEASVDEGRVNIDAISAWLDGDGNEAVLGDNPRAPGSLNIFSAAPVVYSGELRGYLYIVLASHESISLANSLQSSHMTRVLFGGLSALVVFFILSALFSFKRITRPLQKLGSEMRAYREVLFDQHEFGDRAAHRDEIEELSHAFQLMRERIQKQFDQLAENDRLRRELVSNISHDLRTPLAAMQGYLETSIIKANDLDKGTQRQYLEVAHRHSQHLRDLVSQLFELSKLEAGTVAPEYEVFSLTELLYDIRQDYELKAQETGVVLRADVPQENILVEADISLMQRVLRNLIDNAFTHSSAGSSITLSLSLTGSQVAVGVFDTGDGITEEELPYVFDRFYQSASGSAAADRKAGAGLGLSIVKKILDLHNSVISVKSVHQAGTEFSFSLMRA